MTLRKTMVAWLGAALAACLAVAGVTAVSASAASFARAQYAPTTAWTWVNDASLGSTDTAGQFAQADVSGLTDQDHNAGFRLRYSATSNILVAVSATAWKTEPSAGSYLAGNSARTASGNLKVTIDSANLLTIFWNGTQIAQRTVPGTYTGRGVVPVVWQSSAGVKMTNIVAGDIGSPSPSPSTSVPGSPTATVTVTPTVTAPAVTSTAPAVTVTPGVPTVTVTAPAVTVTPTITVTPTVTATPTETTETPSTSPTSPSPTTESPSPSPSTTSPSPSPTGAAAWLSGASSIYAANGTFGTWRGEPVKIVGTWSDSQDCSAIACSFGTSGDMAGVTGPNISLDIAVGAIWNGQSWANAAAGAYNAQWQSMLTALKGKLATKGMDPKKVYIRFAHEMNGNWTEWKVPTGQEANFRNAIARFSSLRYSTFSDTNAPQVVLCPNDGSSSGMANPENLFVKTDGLGRKVVDVYCLDTYNQYPHRTDAAAVWASLNDTTNPDSIESHRKFAEAQGVPLSVGEWGNCGILSECAGGGGESPAYVEQMNRYFRAHAGTSPGELLYEVQFNLWPRFALYGPEGNQPATAAKYASLVWGQ